MEKDASWKEQIEGTRKEGGRDDRLMTGLNRFMRRDLEVQCILIARAGRQIVVGLDTM